MTADGFNGDELNSFDASQLCFVVRSHLVLSQLFWKTQNGICKSLKE